MKKHWKNGEWAKKFLSPKRRQGVTTRETKVEHLAEDPPLYKFCLFATIASLDKFHQFDHENRDEKYSTS
jgi:hypothetical protein